MSVRIVKLIYCDELRLGTGDSREDPIRKVVQLFTLDGDLVIQHDPHPTPNPNATIGEGFYRIRKW